MRYSKGLLRHRTSVLGASALIALCQCTFGLSDGVPRQREGGPAGMSGSANSAGADSGGSGAAGEASGSTPGSSGSAGERPQAVTGGTGGTGGGGPQGGAGLAGQAGQAGANGPEGWSGWVSLGTTWAITPAVAAEADGRIHVAVRVSSMEFETRTYNPGAGWSPWVNIGGSHFLTAPQMVPGVFGLAMFSRATDGRMMNKAWRSGSGWWPSEAAWNWFNVDPPLLGLSAAAHQGLVHMIAHDPAFRCLYRTWDPTNNVYSPWTTGFGSCGVTPLMVACGDRELHLFGVGSEGALWRNRVSGGTWGGWTVVDEWMRLERAPAGVCLTVDERVVLVAAAHATNGNVKLRSWDPLGRFPGSDDLVTLGAVAGGVSITYSGAGDLSIVARGFDDTLLYKSWSVSEQKWRPSETGWDVLLDHIDSNPVIIAPSHSTVQVYVHRTHGDLVMNERRAP